MIKFLFTIGWLLPFLAHASKLNTDSLMVGERLVSIYCPLDNTDWIYVKTNVCIYEIRVGAVSVSSEKLDLSNFESIENADYSLNISQVWTNGETIMLELENGSFVSLGALEINSDGSVYLSVLFTNSEDSKSEFSDIHNNQDYVKVGVERARK